MTSVSLPSSLEEIGSRVFYSCQSLESIDIPTSVQHIGTSAFGYCISLTDVNIPEGVTTLNRTFESNSSLMEIEIPASVTAFGEYAFYGCRKLNKIYFKNPTPASVGTYALENVPSSCTLYVPKNTADAYSSATGWRSFTNIKENHYDFTTNTPIDITISSAKWSTLILPYNATIPSGIIVYSCDGSDDDLLTIVEQNEIKANTPYLVYGEPGIYNFDGVASAWEDTYDDGWFTGAYVETAVPENSYILAKVSGVLGFYRVTGSNVGITKVAPYRCYLTPESCMNLARAFRFPNEDESTGINSITTSTTTDIFDVMGHKLNSPQKGINIINGRLRYKKYIKNIMLDRFAYNL